MEISALHRNTRPEGELLPQEAAAFSLLEALGALLRLPAVAVQFLPGGGLRLLEDAVPLLLRLLDDGVRHPLGREQRGPHGVLRGPVLLHLFHQDLQLGLQRGILFIERRVVVGELVQKLVHHSHVVAAHHHLGEGAGGNLLRCQHSRKSSPARKSIWSTIWSIRNTARCFPARRSDLPRCPHGRG